MSEPPVEVDRTVSAVASRRKTLSYGATVGIGVAATCALIGFVFWMDPGKHDEEPAKSTETRLGQAVQYPQPPVTKAALSTEAAKPPPPAVIAQPALPSIANTIGAREEKPAGARMYSYAAPPAPAAPAAAQGASGPTRTAVAFKPTEMQGGRAGRALDQTMMLMPGIHHCILESAIQSDLAGPILCHLRDDALSPTGVVLMPAGTHVVGSYKTAGTQGQSRLMTMAATAYTPDGVPVPLDMPMTDGIGRAGLEGEVNNHIWSRFGGGVMLALGDAAIGVLQSSFQKGGSTNLNFGSGTGALGSLAEDVLRQQMDQKPTITVNQGEDVGIFITYPIDFGDAYRLVPR